MAQQLFLDVESLLSILIGELPEGVFATDRADDPDPDKRSYSSVELRAMSIMLGTLYENLENIDANKFITTVQPDGLPAWERDLFAAVQDSMLSFSVRQQRLLSQLRAIGGINFPTIKAIVDAILTPLGLPFQILTYCGSGPDPITGAWILGLSALGLDTFLALEDPLLGTGLGPGLTPLDCDLDYAAAGLTAQDLANIQATAYTYEVQIFGNADAQTLALLDKQLTAKEPARSTHVIRNNAPGPVSPDVLDLGPFNADTLINVIDAGQFTVPASTYDVWDLGGF